jgi:hypothetical protein
MSRESTCRCLICDLERTLSTEISSHTFKECYRLFVYSRALLSTFPSVSDLLSFLHTRKSNNGIVDSDGILRELLRTAATEPDFAALRDLVLLAFIPLLHSTYRQVARRYRSFSSEDVAQHVVTFLLQILARPEFYRRSSYVAFHISRLLKRHSFEWARRETRATAPCEFDETSLGSSFFDDASKSIERIAILRHFLSRCVERGWLTNAELDLLIQFKLDAARDRMPGGPAAIYSNAMRQRMKRVLRKLRQIAQSPKYGRQLRLF